MPDDDGAKVFVLPKVKMYIDWKTYVELIRNCCKS